jgi:hypothetical protein
MVNLAMDHLCLGRPVEVTDPGYRCPICGRRLSTIRAPWTAWEEHLRTEDGTRHYKKYCNIMRDAHIMFRRMFGQDW